MRLLLLEFHGDAHGWVTRSTQSVVLERPTPSLCLQSLVLSGPECGDTGARATGESSEKS